MLKLGQGDTAITHGVNSNSTQFHLVNSNSNSTSNLSIPIPIQNRSIPIQFRLYIFYNVCKIFLIHFINLLFSDIHVPVCIIIIHLAIYIIYMHVHIHTNKHVHNVMMCIHSVSDHPQTDPFVNNSKLPVDPIHNH